MYKNLQSNFILFLIAILTSYFLWDYINLPFYNRNEIVSELTDLKVNPLNQAIRFYLSPTLAFVCIVAFLIIIKKQKYLDIFHYYKKNLNIGYIFKNNNDEYKIPYYCFIILFFLSIFSYFTGIKFYPVRELDLMHHGEHLTSAFNYLNTNKLWLSSYINHGAGKDIFLAYIPWKIFNTVSVGSYELGKIIAVKVILNIVTFTFLIQVSNLFIKKNSSRIIFISSFIFLYYLFFRHYLAKINFDETFVFLPLIFLFGYYYTNRNFFIIFAFIFSPLSYFWSIDIGIVVNILLFINLIIITIFAKNIKTSILAVITVLFSWLFFYICVGSLEFNKFVENTLHLYETVGYTQGRVIPKILTSSLSTLPIAGLTFLSLYIGNKFLKKSENGFLWINLLIISMLFYISPIGTYGSGHVKHGSVFSVITIYLILFMELDKFLNYKIKKLIGYFVIFFLLVFNICYPFYQNNIYSLGERIDKLIKMDEYAFIDSFDRKDLKEAIRFYKENTKNDDCIMVLNNDVAFPFLLRKKSCSDVILLFNASSKKMRMKLLEDIKKTNPNIILISTPERWNIIRGVENERRHPEVFEYVYKNYILIKNINNWKFYKKIKSF